jgi:hypothetical protein
MATSFLDDLEAGQVGDKISVTTSQYLLAHFDIT